MAQPSESFFLWSCLTGDAVQLAVDDGAAAATGALDPGMYLLCADTKCRVKQGDAEVEVDASSGFKLLADIYFGPIWVDSDTNSFISAIALSGSGTLELIPVKES